MFYGISNPTSSYHYLYPNKVGNTQKSTHLIIESLVKVLSKFLMIPNNLILIYFSKVSQQSMRQFLVIDSMVQVGLQFILLQPLF